MKTEIAKIVTAFAEYYGKKLTPNQIVMYCEDLSELTPAELIEACKRYRNDPDRAFFPLPAQLKGYVKPKITDTDEANEVTNFIIKAMSRDGYTNPDRAENNIGPLGWEVVQRLGGWTHVCQNTKTDEIGIFRAQVRGLVEVISKRAKRGELDSVPQLPQATDVTKLIASSMKGIE